MVVQEQKIKNLHLDSKRSSSSSTRVKSTAVVVINAATTITATVNIITITDVTKQQVKFRVKRSEALQAEITMRFKGEMSSP